MRNSFFVCVLTVALFDVSFCHGNSNISKDISIVYNHTANSSFLIFPYLWQPIALHVTCPSSRFAMFHAKDMETLHKKIEKNEWIWCGLNGWLMQNSCSISISALEPSYVAVHPSSLAKGCKIFSNAQFSYAMMLCAVLGVSVFLLADYLSTSMLFRLSAGTLIFTSSSLLLLLVVALRFMPLKKQTIFTMVTFGSSFMALAKWLWGQWLPSAHQILHSYAFLTYVLASSLTGLAVTYYFDDRRNSRLNTILKVGLRLCGLFLLYLGTWTSFWSSMALISMLVIGHLMAPLLGSKLYIGGGFHKTAERKQTVVVEASRTFRPIHLSTTPQKLKELQLMQGPVTPIQASSFLTFDEKMNQLKMGASSTSAADLNVSEAELSPLVKSGFILNEASGKTVKLGGVQFNKLVEQGAIPDYASGILLAPKVKTPGQERRSSRSRSGAKR